MGGGLFADGVSFSELSPPVGPSGVGREVEGAAGMLRADVLDQTDGKLDRDREVHFFQLPETAIAIIYRSSLINIYAAYEIRI